MTPIDRATPFPEHQWLTWRALRFDMFGCRAAIGQDGGAFVTAALDAARLPPPFGRSQ